MGTDISTTTSYETVTTLLPKGDDEGRTRALRIAARLDDLNAHARAGYVVTHTATIDGAEFVTFVDTLARSN